MWNFIKLKYCLVISNCNENLGYKNLVSEVMEDEAGNTNWGGCF